jgi:PQQ-dependent catabolism-associated CXXCW motif protein
MKTLNTLAAALLLASALPVLAQNSFGAPQAPPSPQPQPPGAYGAPPAQPGFGAAQQGTSAERMAQAERQDMGVPPTDRLHTGPMHGPTPNALPGGQVITTPGLVALMKNGPQTLVFDVLGGPEKLPGALYALPAHQAGSFDDAVQREFGKFLQSQTQGRNEVPLVFYCQSTQCWMSYNAALRAVKLGYRNVLWYRGGVEAWKAAGQQMQPAQR